MTYALVNDQFLLKENVSIGLEDRGYQFGDGVYEVIGVYNNTPFKLKEHLLRLFESMKKVRMELNYRLEDLSSQLMVLKEKNNLQKGLIYIQITRGVSLRNHPFPTDQSTPVLTAYTIEMNRPDSKVYQEGVKVILTEDVRWLRCDIKTINLLPNVLAKQEAMEAGAFEAILYRDNYGITEGSSTNVFIVKNGEVFTHPANHYILNGITRQTVIDICKELDIKITEVAFSKESLLEADEVFITGTYIDIVPVTEIRNETAGFSSVGEVTKKLINKIEKMTLSENM